MISSIFNFTFFSQPDRNPYAPFPATCPDHAIVREASNISDNEKSYIQQRQAVTNKNLITFLNDRANLSNFDAEKFINDYSSEHNITLGLAFSGGGYRAMLCGAGEMLGLDSRYSGAKSNGLGGLLQSATYMSGLSGGSWLVGSVVLNDFISIEDVLNGDINIWNLEDSIINPSGINIFGTVQYYTDIEEAVSAKMDAGFNASITDVWGRALSHQFFPDDNSGENVTWSSIRNLSSFQDHSMPYPIVVANGRTPGSYIINENSTVFEVSPYELGSWDPSLNSFSDVQFLGSYMDNGTPNNSDSCIVNFDNAGFIMGTSSSLFNQFILQLNGTGIPDAIKSVINDILSRVSHAEVDIALYFPNPFRRVETAASINIVLNNTLYLVDGGEDLQNVPYYPLIQPDRKLDIIFAYDNSADTEQSWPNGTSISYTYLRQFSDQGRGTPFPFVPGVDDFLDQGLNQRPTFFGCDAENMTNLLNFHGNPDLNVTDIPLVVQLTNQRFSYNSNTSTFKMSYDDDEVRSMIQNGFEVSSRGNFSDDDNWARCVGCAIIRRSQERLGLEQSEECKECFDQYCWRGGEKGAASATVDLESYTTLASIATSSHSELPEQSSATAEATTTSSTTKKSGGQHRAVITWSIASFFVHALEFMFLF
ncbi:phospholipase B3 [Scheffersomyces stipitis CBS 6054]|uniref:Lysophospholipase n=1 Tax=Scheffersomyces stipitis (strain ATCC 58785 / CBS 6054 / NBRC 10063 / NRRL Y-11545) TaxID=322104 RepID=A3LQB5_PICST|nr:phospholipase B3 [Scheffersomyces stipitis CBS 6054]ABN64650.2 phospholipase B3 [Scheffersomyces stipitis CBS 6054]